MSFWANVSKINHRLPKRGGYRPAKTLFYGIKLKITGLSFAVILEKKNKITTWP